MPILHRLKAPSPLFASPMLVVAVALAVLPGRGSAAEPNQVNMNLDQFLKLYEATKNRPDDPEEAPRHYAIASARYTGEVIIEDEDATSAVFEARMRVDVLREKGWVRVPLLPASVAVRSAKIGGQEAPLVLENGYYTLITQRRGALDIDLEFAVAINTSKGSSGFAFQLARSGATEVSLSVPAEDALDFTVANAKLQRDRVVGKRRIVEATLPSNGSLSVTWQKEIPEAEVQDARIYSTVNTLVGIGEGLLKTHTVINQTILFDGVDQLQFDVPTDMTVLDVQGSGLRDWTVDENGILTALLNFEAEGSYTLTLDLERVVGEATALDVPLITPLGVERSKGFVGVQALGNLELASGEVQDAAAVDVRTLPASIIGITGQPVLLGFKYLGDEPGIPLTISDHDEVDVLVTLLDQASATTMFTAEGRRLTSVNYQVRNNRRQFLRLALPEDAELWSASVAGKSVQPAAGADGKLLIPLIRSQASQGALAAFGVEVVYVESGDGPDPSGKGLFIGKLPKADAPTTYVDWTVYAPWEAKINERSKRGSLRPVDHLTQPLGFADFLEVQNATQDFVQSARGQSNMGTLGQGATPVMVSLPLDGQPIFFEKLLALDEDLTVEFGYSKLK
jgi:hypothetical protein